MHNSLPDKIFNHVLDQRRVLLDERQNDLFLHACKLAVQENDGESSATMAANIYLNLILRNPTMTLPPLEMKDRIKEVILDKLRNNNDCCFAEATTDLDRLGLSVIGDEGYYFKENVMIWDGTTADFNNAIDELVQERKITLQPLEKSRAMVIYGYGVKVLDLPIVSSDEDCHTLHWLPMLMRKGIGFS